jgi:hypothetical protein
MMFFETVPLKRTRWERFLGLNNEQRFTMTQETWEALNARNKHIGVAMQPFVGKPICGNLARDMEFLIMKFLLEPDEVKS